MFQLSNENGVKIEMNNENTYQISFCTKLNNNSNIRDILKQNKFYDLLHALNKDFIESFVIYSNQGYDCVEYKFNFGNYMSDFFDKTEDVKYCLNIINKSNIISNDKFEIRGTTNNQYVGNIKQCKITDIVIVIDIIGENIVMFLSYKNNDNDSNKIQKKSLVNILSKILTRFKSYLE